MQAKEKRFHHPSKKNSSILNMLEKINLNQTDLKSEESKTKILTKQRSDIFRMSDLTTPDALSFDSGFNS